MKEFKIFALINCLLLSMLHEIIAQGLSYKPDSIELGKANKWIRIAKKEYPTDMLRQNVSIFTNLFWGDKSNSQAISAGMDSLWKYEWQSKIRSFQGSFSFLVSFDDKGEIQKLSFSKNVPVEFISVVQRNFNSSLVRISERDKLKGMFKSKKILLRLNLIWSFTNRQGLREYIDDGLSNLEFNDEGSTLGEVLMAPSNLMSREI